MKMKKLTALALAGVLCLGMSTTAFAAASPGKTEATYAIDEKGEKISGITNTDVQDSAFDSWKVDDPNKASKNIKKDLNNRLGEIRDLLDPEENDNYGSLTQDQIDALKAEQEALEGLQLDSDVKFEVAMLGDVDYTGGLTVDEDNPLTVRFDLNGRLENIKAGDKIHLMHLVTENGLSNWVVYDCEVQLDDNGYFVTYDFTSFSPVAIIRYNSDGSTTVQPPQGGITGDPTDTPTITPNADGTITADQLADLIVQRLEQNAKTTKVVRTAGKPSPKTGE